MPQKRTSPWIYVLGILFILLIVVIFLVLRASQKMASPDTTAGSTDTSNFLNKKSVPTTSNVADTTTTSSTIAGQAIVDVLELQVLESFPVQVTATIRGNLNDACTTAGQPLVNYVSQEKKFSILIPTSKPANQNTVCAQVQVPYTKSVSLNVNNLVAGTYTVVAGSQTKTFLLTSDNILDTTSGK